VDTTAATRETHRRQFCGPPPGARHAGQVGHAGHCCSGVERSAAGNPQHVLPFVMMI
jgi:hypothetical protein